jgi:DNA-binding FadR family transcriptional regulator
MLQPLPSRPSATAAAEHALRDAIVSGELAAGDRLPPERVLSKQLGVSRLTLRAALATLSAAGLISVRHGSGYTVRDLRESGGTDLLAGLIDPGGKSTSERAEAAADLLRLRRHLAGAVLEAIAERSLSVAKRRAVHAAIDRFADATAELAAAHEDTGSPDANRTRTTTAGVAARLGDERAVQTRSSSLPGAATSRLRAAELAIVEADLGVVRSLLDASGSMILRVCLNPIIAVLRDSAPLRAAIYARPETNLLGWRALGAWIDRPDAAAIPVLIGVLLERDRATVDTLRKGPKQ